MTRHHDHAQHQGHAHHDHAHQDGQHQHQHGHGTPDLDWNVIGPYIEREGELNTPVFEQAALWLRELRPGTDGKTDAGAAPAPSRILDVGSGPGVATAILAGTFPTAEVVAVDGADALLARARERADRLGLGERISTRLADLDEGLDGLAPADLVWSSKALHHIGDQRAAVALLARQLRPGGLLAVAEGGLRSRCLPRDFGIGRPGFEARLEAAVEDWFADMRAGLPGAATEVEDWPALLTAAGLDSVGSRSFLLDLPAPLPDPEREHLCTSFERLGDMLGDRIAAEDRATLDRLLDPGEPAGLRRRPDVFLLQVQTVHVARVRIEHV